MRKFLSIVIPRYNETEQDVFPLLTSINNQVGIDFDSIEVIVCNDGGGAGELNHDFLKLFGKLDIKQANLTENKGSGIARQTGIEAAKGQYLMFCDADDILHNVGVLGAMMQEADNKAPDILATNWLEELVTPDGQYRYLTHSHENTWMHGKLIRRQYLLQNDIRHHDSLRVHEDSYILALVSAFTDRQAYLDITSYVWKYHSDSITRRNNAVYTYDSIPTFIYACSEAHKEIEKRNPALMEYKIVQFILYNYFCFHQPGWLAEENRNYLRNAEAALVENIQPFLGYWRNVKAETLAEIYNQERSKNFVGCIENETLDEWCKRLGLGAE